MMNQSRILFRNAQCVTRANTARILHVHNQQRLQRSNVTAKQSLTRRRSRARILSICPSWLRAFVPGCGSRCNLGAFAFRHYAKLMRHGSTKKVASHPKMVTTAKPTPSSNALQLLKKRGASNASLLHRTSERTIATNAPNVLCAKKGPTEETVSIEECERRCDLEVRRALEKLTMAMKKQAIHIACANKSRRTPRKRTSGKQAKKKKEETKGSAGGKAKDPCGGQQKKKKEEKKKKKEEDPCVGKQKKEEKKCKGSTEGKKTKKEDRKESDPCIKPQSKKAGGKKECMANVKKASKSGCDVPAGSLAKQSKSLPTCKAKSKKEAKRSKSVPSRKSSSEADLNECILKLKKRRISEETAIKAKGKSKKDAGKKKCASSGKEMKAKSGRKSDAKKKPAKDICKQKTSSGGSKKKDNKAAGKRTSKTKASLDLCKTSSKTGKKTRPNMDICRIITDEGDEKGKESDPCRKVGRKSSKTKSSSNICKKSSKTTTKKKSSKNICKKKSSSGGMKKDDDPCKNIGKQSSKTKSSSNICKKTSKTTAKKKSSADICKKKSSSSGMKKKNDDPCKNIGKQSSKTKSISNICKKTSKTTAKKKSSADICKKKSSSSGMKKKDNDACKNIGKKSSKTKSSSNICKKPSKTTAKKKTSADICKKKSSSSGMKKKDNDPCKNIGKKSSKTKASSNICKKTSKTTAKKKSSADICKKKSSSSGMKKKDNDPCKNIGKKSSKTKSSSNICKKTSKPTAKKKSSEDICKKKDDPCTNFGKKTSKSKSILDLCKKSSKTTAKKKSSKDICKKKSSSSGVNKKDDDPCKNIGKKTSKTKSSTDICKKSSKTAKAKKRPSMDICKIITDKGGEKDKESDPCKKVTKKSSKTKSSSDICKKSSKTTTKKKPSKSRSKSATKKKSKDPCSEIEMKTSGSKKSTTKTKSSKELGTRKSSSSASISKKSSSEICSTGKTTKAKKSNGKLSYTRLEHNGKSDTAKAETMDRPKKETKKKIKRLGMVCAETDEHGSTESHPAKKKSKSQKIAKKKSSSDTCAKKVSNKCLDGHPTVEVFCPSAKESGNVAFMSTTSSHDRMQPPDLDESVETFFHTSSPSMVASTEATRMYNIANILYSDTLSTRSSSEEEQNSPSATKSDDAQKVNEMEISSNATKQKMTLTVPAKAERIVFEVNLDDLRRCGPLTTCVSTGQENVVHVEQSTSHDQTKEFRRANMKMPVNAPPTSLTKIKLYTLQSHRRRQTLTNNESQDIQKFVKSTGSTHPNTLVFKAQRVVSGKDQVEDENQLDSRKNSTLSEKSLRHGVAKQAYKRSYSSNGSVLGRKSDGTHVNEIDEKVINGTSTRSTLVTYGPLKMVSANICKGKPEKQVKIDVQACKAKPNLLDEVERFKKITLAWNKKNRRAQRLRLHPVGSEVRPNYSDRSERIRKGRVERTEYARNLQRHQRMTHLYGLLSKRRMTDSQRAGMHTMVVARSTHGLAKQLTTEQMVLVLRYAGAGTEWDARLLLNRSSDLIPSLSTYILRWFPSLLGDMRPLKTPPKLLCPITTDRWVDERVEKMSFHQKRIVQAQQLLGEICENLFTARIRLDSYGPHLSTPDQADNDQFQDIERCYGDKLNKNICSIIEEDLEGHEMSKTPEEMEQQLDVMEVQDLNTRASETTDLLRDLEDITWKATKETNVNTL